MVSTLEVETIYRPSVTIRARGALQPGEIGEGFVRVLPAHFLAGPKADADLGPVRLSEKKAEVVLAQLNAAYARGFAVRHSGNGRGYREAYAAGPAAGPAVHFGL
jgi:hypothetical protein